MNKAFVFDWYGTLWVPEDKATIENPFGLSPKCFEVFHSLSKSNVSLAIISNTDDIGTDSWIRNELSKINCLQFFNIVVSSADVGVHKPDPDIFLLTARFLHCQPHYITMIGDSKTTDGGATKVGWNFKLVDSFSPTSWMSQL